MRKVFLLGIIATSTFILYGCNSKTEVECNDNHTIKEVFNEKVWFQNEEDNLWGILDLNTDKRIVESEFTLNEEIEYIENEDILKVEKDGKNIVFNKKGEKLFSLESNINPIKLGVNNKQIIVKNDKDEFAVLNNEGKEIIKFSKEEIDSNKNAYLVLYNENKNKLFDENGKEIEWTKDFNNIYLAGDYFETIKDNKFGLSNKNGDVILDNKYLSIKEENNFFYIELDKDKYSLFDGNSKKLIANDEFKEIRKFNKDLYIVKNNKDKFGIIDREGKYILNMEYDSIDEKNIIYKGNKLGYIDNLGKIVVEAKYDLINKINENELFVKLNDKSFIVKNKIEKEINSMPTSVDDIIDCNKLLVDFKGKKQIINHLGENYTKTYNNIKLLKNYNEKNINNKYILVGDVRNKYNLYDLDKEKELQEEYIDGYMFRENILLMLSKNKIKVVDNLLNEKFSYEDENAEKIEIFKGKYLKIYYKDKVKYLDLEGKEINL